MTVELCACPQCGLPAEVVDDPEPAGAAPTARANDLVGVRCVRRHWFFGPRQRLVA